jgi:hypothetical protein
MTRRNLILTIGGVVAGSARLYAFSDDFWNKKDPKDWSSDEVTKLTTKSPWAKEVGANYVPAGGGGGGGYGGGGGGGGMGRGGGGGGGGNRRNGPGTQPQNYKGTIRWESAKAIMDATKMPLDAAFTNHYVISVTGFPVQELGARRQQSQNQDSDQALQDMLDHLKGVTFLQPKEKRDMQPGIVKQPAAGSYGTTVLFGFSKEVLALKPEDKEVTFVTSFGRMDLKAKFNLKEMMYHDELAV